MQNFSKSAYQIHKHQNIAQPGVHMAQGRCEYSFNTKVLTYIVTTAVLFSPARQKILAKAVARA